MTAGRPAPDYLARNRRVWDHWAGDYAKAADRLWVGEPCWGVFGVAESELGVLPPDLTGLRVLEDGCGTGYVSAWLARRGALPVGLDNSAAQLATARRLQREHGLSFPLVQAAAEDLPFADGSFDFVISEYGAAIWSDPYRWVPEAARVLRSGGELVFLGGSTLMMLCVPDEEGMPAGPELRRPQRGMHRFEWPEDESVEFHLSPGEWVRLLRRCGFEVTDLIEVYPPEGASIRYPFVTAEWAQRWPCEEVWKARRAE